MSVAGFDGGITPRQRVVRALNKQQVDRVPFTIYESKIPQSTEERQMRNKGLCIVYRKIQPYKVHRPNVKVTQHNECKDGKNLTTTVYETPVGTVQTMHESAGFTSWHHERMFKTPNDYKTLLFMVEDEHYEENYAAFAAAENDFGPDAIFRASIGLEPLQSLISGNIMAMETFCMEWMENRDEILKIYQATVEKHRQIYPIIAQSPALIANYGGNVVAEILGAETFEKYYVPHYNEAAEIFHKHGKMVGCHFDGNCGILREAIGRTELDYIEAFSPAPDTDMTLAEARQAWPDKVLWINYPSSAHLLDADQIRETALDLLKQAGSPEGFIMGITEDIPQHCWKRNCLTIMEALKEDADSRKEYYSN